jgi:hypothetical protein
MYSIPENFPLDKLQGAEIQQICFASNVIVIQLFNLGYIQLETEFTFTSDLDVLERCNPYPSRKELACLLGMIEAKILKVETDDDRRNLVIFTNQHNQRLEILRNDLYEMGSIKIEDHYIII